MVLLTPEYTVSYSVKGKGKKSTERQHLKSMVQDCVVLEKGILQAGLNPEAILWKIPCVDFFRGPKAVSEHLFDFRENLSYGSSQEPQVLAHMAP